MALSGMPVGILVAKVILAILSFLFGGFLIWLGVNLIRDQKGHGTKAVSKFKFWGINVSSPSGGLVVVVVSLAWGLIGVKIMPDIEYKDGPIKIAMLELATPIAETMSAMKATDGKQSPGLGEVFSKFEDLAKKKYANDQNTTVVTDIGIEEQRPVFKLRASTSKKAVEERFTAALKNGTLIFTPFGVSAVDTELPFLSMKFDCASSIEAFLREPQEVASKSDLETHKKALNTLCPSEIHQLPVEQQLIFKKTIE